MTTMADPVLTEVRAIVDPDRKAAWSPASSSW
jgi:hypothetical protein